jgi:hypothetical protein
MASPLSENESGYSPISGAIDAQPSGNPSVGALFSAGGKSGIVVYIFEKIVLNRGGWCRQCVSGQGVAEPPILYMSTALNKV